jgi:hypothetical protein
METCPRHWRLRPTKLHSRRHVPRRRRRSIQRRCALSAAALRSPISSTQWQPRRRRVRMLSRLSGGCGARQRRRRHPGLTLAPCAPAVARQQRACAAPPRVVLRANDPREKFRCAPSAGPSSAAATLASDLAPHAAPHTNALTRQRRVREAPPPSWPRTRWCDGS